MCLKGGPGSGLHLGLELKYKATLKPDDAERVLGDTPAGTVSVQQRYKLSLLQSTTPTIKDVSNDLLPWGCIHKASQHKESLQVMKF